MSWSMPAVKSRSRLQQPSGWPDGTGLGPKYPWLKTAPPISKRELMKWEYFATDKSTYGVDEMWLNRMGEANWELITVNILREGTLSHHPYQYTYVFKRPKKR